MIYRLLLHCKQANDRASRTLKSFSHQLSLFDSLRLSNHSVMSIPRQILDLMKPAIVDHASRRYLTISMKSTSQQESWMAFCRQQELIAEGIEHLATCTSLVEISLQSKSTLHVSRLTTAGEIYESPATCLQKKTMRLHTAETLQLDTHHAYHTAYMATTRGYPEVRFEFYHSNRWTHFF